MLQATFCQLRVLLFICTARGINTSDFCDVCTVTWFGLGRLAVSNICCFCLLFCSVLLLLGSEPRSLHLLRHLPLWIVETDSNHPPPPRGGRGSDLANQSIRISWSQQLVQRQTCDPGLAHQRTSHSLLEVVGSGRGKALKLDQRILIPSLC